MAYFRKKPVVIEAVQWTGKNPTEILDFIDPSKTQASGGLIDDVLSIATLEGVMRADLGDWIIKGVASEATYEPVEAPDDSHQT